MTEQDYTFNKLETQPKTIQIFQEFDVRSVHAGLDFAFLIVKEKDHETLHEQSV